MKFEIKYKTIISVLVFLMGSILIPNISSGQSTDFCTTSANCTAVSACEIDVYNIAGDVACTGNWNYLNTYCYGSQCVDSYVCDSSCVTQGQQVTSNSCVNNWCSYTSGGPCTTNIGQCWWNEVRANSDPLSDGPTTNPLGGEGSTCSDISTQPILVYTFGSNFTISQGDPGWVGIQYTSQDSTTMNIAVADCPSGATCTANSPINNDGDGFPYSNVGANITNTSSLSPGTYPIKILLTNAGNAGCKAEATVYLTVEPSRQTVCDGNWYSITGSLAAYKTPVGKYFSTPATMNVFAPNASTGRNVYEQICSGATSGQACTWNSLPGWTNVGLFSSVVDQPIHIPSTNYRNAIASTLSNGMYQLSSTGWSVFSGPAPVWGNPTSTSDPYGRTYQFRRGSGNVAEYSCLLSQPDMTADTLSTVGTLTTGQSIGFSARVVNTGTAPTVASQSRLRIDLGNDGTWDLAILPNQSTGVLAPSGNEVETWSNAWNAVAGTHKFEICTDITNTVAESNESNNCVNSAPFTVAGNAVPSISANPASVITGNSSNITWSCSNGVGSVTCSSGACPWNGSSGVNNTGVLVANRTYTLTCNNGGASANVTVLVTPDNYSLNVIKSGQGTVTGVSNPIQTNINCGSVCSNIYEANSTVVLTATPASGRIFTGWSVQGGGSCPGKGTCTVTVDAAKTVTANFAVDPNYKEF